MIFAKKYDLAPWNLHLPSVNFQVELRGWSKNIFFSKLWQPRVFFFEIFLDSLVKWWNEYARGFKAAAYSCLLCVLQPIRYAYRADVARRFNIHKDSFLRGTTITMNIDEDLADLQVHPSPSYTGFCTGSRYVLCFPCQMDLEMFRLQLIVV